MLGFSWGVATNFPSHLQIEYLLYKILFRIQFEKMVDLTYGFQVPEMLRLYNDPNPDTVNHSRLLLMRLVSDGVRTEEDCRLVVRSGLVPLLLSLLLSPTATPALQVSTLRLSCIHTSFTILFSSHQFSHKFVSLFETLNLYDIICL